MSNIDTPENILLALDAIEEELVALVGGNWTEIESKYRDLYNKLTDEDGKWLASIEIKELFAPYNAARERLDTTIAEQDFQEVLMLGLADMAAQIGLDSAPLARIAQSDNQTRSVRMKSPTKAKSIKLGNIDFDFGEMGELCAGIIGAVNKLWGETGVKQYVLLAAGVLLIARSLYKAMTTELTEREATVFYGFTQAAGEDKTAAEAVIREKANLARDEIGLNQLDEADVKNALYKLSELKSVARIEGHVDQWRIIEEYRIKD